MHDLSNFPDGSFDCVYSSHTIEHAYEPSRMLGELARVLATDGALIVVLPYPDQGEFNVRAHGAKFELGTNIDDQARTVVRYFEKHAGLKAQSVVFDNFREPEVWLHFANPQ